MAQAGPGIDKSLRAGADLNTTTSDFRLVRVNSTASVAIANTTTQRSIGILQNRPRTGTGASAWVRMAGLSKLTMNDTCAAGDLIMTGDGGARRATGVTITADSQIIGRALEASAITGTVIEVLLGFHVVHLAVGFTTTAINAGGNNVVLD